MKKLLTALTVLALVGNLTIEGKKDVQFSSRGHIRVFNKDELIHMFESEHNKVVPTTEEQQRLVRELRTTLKTWKNNLTRKHPAKVLHPSLDLPKHFQEELVAQFEETAPTLNENLEQLLLYVNKYNTSFNKVEVETNREILVLIITELLNFIH